MTPPNPVDAGDIVYAITELTTLLTELTTLLRWGIAGLFAFLFFDSLARNHRKPTP